MARKIPFKKISAKWTPVHAQNPAFDELVIVYIHAPSSLCCGMGIAKLSHIDKDGLNWSIIWREGRNEFDNRKKEERITYWMPLIKFEE